MTFTHNALADDLARYLRARTGRVVWTDMQLGPVGSPRPNVYSLEPSFTKFCPLAYEVKVSVADCPIFADSSRIRRWLIVFP